MIKKHLGITSLLSISFLLVTACGSNSTPSTDTATKTENAQPKEILLQGVDNPLFQDLLVKQFPQYHFTFYKASEKPSLQDLVAQGTPIDMVMESYGQFSSPGFALSLGLQYDMTDLVKKHNFDLSRFEQSPIQGIQQLGGLYGIPITLSPLVLYYNKDIFDKFGVAYPKNGMTWDQISELAKKFDQNVDGVQYVGFVTDVDHPWNSNQLSLPYVDPKTGNASVGTAD
ncbi:MAG: extracellular solute-binding protein family 1, partial [Bacilli bacterium]|nr:extracellular solute-binding protein family 1 [Bacilli bacterium]